MTNNIIEITHRHGEEMRRLALEHALELAKMYRDYSDNAIDRLVAHLQSSLTEEQSEHSRFDEQHRETCDSCREAYSDFLTDQEWEAA